MTGWDWLIVAALLLSVLGAAAQGFFFELFSLAGVVFGYLIAAWAYGRVAPWYLEYVRSPRAADIAGFLTIFIVVVLLASVAGRVVRWMVHGAGLKWFDRVLGAAFGFIRGVLVVTVFLVALAAFAPESRALNNSRLAPYLLVAGRALVWVAPAELRSRFRDGIEALREMRRKRESPPDTRPRTEWQSTHSESEAA